MNQGSKQKEDDSHIALPASLRQYELRTLISQDDVEKVYAARDTSLARDVLLKAISLEEVPVEEMLSKARRVAALKHFAFFRIHSVDLEQKQLFVVMEAVKQTALDASLTSYVGQERRVIRTIQNLAEALQEAELLGLYHGRLRTNRLCLDQSGRVRILDFGLSVGQLDSKAINLGSDSLGLDDLERKIHYLAPECFAHKGPSSEADVFALGVIAYELLTGSVPFSGTSGLALVAAQVQCNSEQWTWPENVSPLLRELVVKMTDRDVKKRASYSEVLQACRLLRADDSASTSLDSNLLGTMQIVPEKAFFGPSAKRHLVLISAAIFCVLLGWQTPKYWPQIIQAITPYSETREMEQGIAALSRYHQVPDPDLPEQAFTHFQRILDRTPDNAEAVAYMSLVYMSRYGNEKRDEIWMQKAKASAQQAMNLNPNLAVSLLAHAKILQWHHQMAEALAATDKALQLDSHNLMVWINKARVLLEMGSVDSLETFTAEGIQRFSFDRVLPELHGVALSTKGDTQGAERAYRLSIQRQPDSVNAYSLLGDLLDQLGRSEEALQIVQRGLQVRPNAQLYSAMGHIMFRKGKYQEAVDALQKAVLPPTGVVGSYFRWYEYAEALMWVPDRREEALEAFRKARQLLEIRLARSPDDSFIMSHMAFIHARLGEFESARSLIRRALSLGSDDDRSKYVLAASIYELANEREYAWKMLFEAKMRGVNRAEIISNPIFKPMIATPQFAEFEKNLPVMR